MDISRLGPQAVALDWTPEGEAWSRDALFISDIHFDAKGCEREMLKRHLDTALLHNSPVFILGDFWDAMQGRDDRRGSKSSLRDEYLASHYFNAIIDDAVNFLEPYGSVIAGWGQGNHETAVKKKHEFDLLQMAVGKLHDRGHTHIVPMGYIGWIFFRLHAANPQGQKRGPLQTLKVAWSHGYGGNAKRTKGVLEADLRAAIFPDADIFLSGHIHQQWALPIPRNRVTSHGRVFQDEQLHVQLPTYKNDHQEDHDEGWVFEKGFAPAPLGGVWLTFTRTHRKQAGRQQHFEVDARRAK